MKRLLFLSVLMMLGAWLVFSGGCSKDKTSTGSTAKTVGDTLDPVFVAVDSGFEDFGDLTPVLLYVTMGYVDSIFSDPGHPSPRKQPRFTKGLNATADSLVYTYHSLSKYWYFYFGHTDTIYTVMVEDSIQFLHGATPAQWPDSALLTGIKAGGSFDFSTPNGSISINQTMHVTGAAGAIPAMGDVVINGSGQVSADGSFFDTSSTCDVTFNMNQTITDLHLNLTDVMMGGCPTAGVVRHAGALGISCTGDTSFTFNDSWTITEAFSGDTITTTFENSTTTWTVTDVCNPIVVKVWDRIKGIVQRQD